MQCHQQHTCISEGKDLRSIKAALGKWLSHQSSCFVCFCFAFHMYSMSTHWKKKGREEPTVRAKVSVISPSCLNYHSIQLQKLSSKTQGLILQRSELVLRDRSIPEAHTRHWHLQAFPIRCKCLIASHARFADTYSGRLTSWGKAGHLYSCPSCGMLWIPCGRGEHLCSPVHSQFSISTGSTSYA